MTNEPISYSLASVNNSTFEGVRELTEGDFQTYTIYISTLRKLSSDENLFRIVELNYIDLESKIDGYIKNFGGGSQNEFEHLMLDTNRLILNFLSAIRTYLDHTETRLKREYSENSQELKTFKTETSSAYDNYFSYRFLYKLRNYSQHCGLPSGSISLNSTGDENGKTVNTLTLSLVRDELLKDFDSWSAPIKEELKAQQEHFDIIPLLQEKAKILKQINKKVNAQIYLKHNFAGQELVKLMLEAQKIKGAPCLIKTTGSKDNLRLTLHWFPFDSISKVTGINIIVRPQTELLKEQDNNASH